MRDERQTKEQLINELVELRQRIAELEASETERKRAEAALRESAVVHMDETGWRIGTLLACKYQALFKIGTKGGGLSWKKRI
jgi:hypothetical protein